MNIKSMNKKRAVESVGLRTVLYVGFLYKLSYSSNEYKNDKSNEQPLEMEMDR